MKIIHKIKDLENLLDHFRSQKKSIGLVPTMGALHAGHASLIKFAAKKDDVIVVSIFVNPLQFGPKEDFKKYPRNLKKDSEICKKSGAQIVFAPGPEFTLKNSLLIKRRADYLNKSLCAIYRPGHFDGVVTIVDLFFRVVKPDHAYFGLKDYQQYLVIKEMARRLHPKQLEVIPVPTHREKDGLAMSSRNAYLSKDERGKAIQIYKSLKKASKEIRHSKKSIMEILDHYRKLLNAVEGFRVQYFDLADAESLELIDSRRKVSTKKMVLAAAVFAGQTRLIDNLLF